jgi:hypothetical protein
LTDLTKHASVKQIRKEAEMKKKKKRDMTTDLIIILLTLLLVTVVLNVSLQLPSLEKNLKNFPASPPTLEELKQPE